MRLSQRKRKERIDVGVLFSFVFSMLAVLSLSLYGVVNVQQSKVSYAYTVPIGEVGDSFEFYVRPWDTVGLRSFTTGSNTGTFKIPMYYADREYKQPVFCVEKQASVDSGVTYNKNNTIVDYKLLYLLNSGYFAAKKILPDQVSNNYTETWVAQTAIWLYLYETDPSNANNAFSEDELTNIQNAQGIYYIDENSREQVVSVPNLYSYVRKVVDEAKTKTGVKELYLNKESDDLTLNGDWYWTSEFGVSSEEGSELLVYDINVNGIEGAKVVDVEGNDMQTTSVQKDKKFRVLVPKSSVTTTAQSLTISVKGHFNGLDGDYFTGVSTSGSALQKVITVTGKKIEIEKGTSIEVVGAPDTAKNAIQILYFIGLIILLSGVGIIYANAKPVQVKQ